MKTDSLQRFQQGRLWQGRAHTGAQMFEPIGRFFLALIYGAIMVVLYQSLSTTWAYLGFDFRAIGTLTGPLVIISSLPALVLPSRPTTLTQLGCWVLFFTLFQPALIIPQLQGWLVGFDALLLYALLWASIVMFIGIARFPIKPLPVPRFDGQIFWMGLLGVWVLMHGVLLLFFGEQLAIAGIGDVYEQRADAAAQLGGGGYLAYVITNASGAINPVLIAIGYFERKWWAIGLGILGQLIVYSTLAGKIVLLFPIVILAAFFLFDKERTLKPVRFGLLMAGVALVGIPLMTLRMSLGDTVVQLIDLIYMRTLYLPGVLVGAYNDFFSIYPLTYFSHSIIGRLFIEYPYGSLSVGQVVGAYVTPSIGYGVNNYNANFIAADGIAGLGLVGIPLIMLAAVLVLRLIDKLLGTVDLRLRCAANVPFLMWLADGSLPTAILTGGGLLLNLFLWLHAGIDKAPARRSEPAVRGR